MLKPWRNDGCSPWLARPDQLLKAEADAETMEEYYLVLHGLLGLIFYRTQGKPPSVGTAHSRCPTFSHKLRKFPTGFPSAPFHGDVFSAEALFSLMTLACVELAENQPG